MQPTLTEPYPNPNRAQISHPNQTRTEPSPNPNLNPNPNSNLNRSPSPNGDISNNDIRMFKNDFKIEYLTGMLFLAEKVTHSLTLILTGWVTYFNIIKSTDQVIMRKFWQEVTTLITPNNP